jgi:hypothetical protein
MGVLKQILKEIGWEDADYMNTVLNTLVTFWEAEQLLVSQESL